ncbi:MAG: FkbM family methyltransferase [Crocinitomicaceae bacterium]|nr:FkbM family methyltransferase [Crocinitomicaceae bacterium]
MFNGNGSNKAEVSLTTLDDYCNENQIENVDIIKVDIEGSEYGFKRRLSSN